VEALYLVCGGRRPQLKRNPLGSGKEASTMPKLTGTGAVMLAVTTVGMMLFIMNAGNSLLVRWGAFLIGSASVVVLALNYRSLWNRPQ
jgi:uncharacterized protein (AIM24 family)